MAILGSFKVGLDRAKPLLQHLALRDGPGILELFTNLAPDEGQALNPMPMLRRSRGGIPQHGLLDLLLDGFAFPTSGHFGLLSHF
jgi:hypothetical protein